MKSPNREPQGMNLIPDLTISWQSKLRRVFTAGIPHFIVLSFIALHRDCVCHKAKVGGNPANKQGHQCHFSNCVCSLSVTGSHFGNSYRISNFFLIVIFVMVI